MNPRNYFLPLVMGYASLMFIGVVQVEIPDLQRKMPQKYLFILTQTIHSVSVQPIWSAV